MLKPFAGGALLALALSSPAQDPKSTIDSKYQALNQSIVKNDPRAMEKWVLAHCDPAFVYTSKGKGKYNRAQFIQGLKDQMRYTKKVSLSTQKVAAFGVTGNKAVVSLASRFKGAIEINGSRLNVSDNSESTDVWVRTKTGWKLRSSKQTKSDTKITPK